MTTNQIIRAYSIQDVSKRIQVPTGTIRQWEKDLKGLLIIPRSKQGARFYTENEIAKLEKIKEMRSKNLSKDMIRMLLKKNMEENSEAFSESLKTAEPPKTLLPAIQEPVQQPALQAEEFMKAMEVYKRELLDNMRLVLKDNRQTLIDEFRSEIGKGSLETVQGISRSIQRANEKRKSEIDSLAEQMAKASESASESAEALYVSISKVSEDTCEKMTKKMNRSSKDYQSAINKAALTVKEAQKEIRTVSKALHQDQEHFVGTMNDNLKELTAVIRDREDAFQNLVTSFRHAAADKEKKAWWKRIGSTRKKEN